MVSTKILSVIELLRKLEYNIISIRYIYLILLHINFLLTGMGNEMSENGAATKISVRVVHSKSPTAHPNPL